MAEATAESLERIGRCTNLGQLRQSRQHTIGEESSVSRIDEAHRAAYDIDLLHATSNDQVADIFTKVMGLYKMWTFLLPLGLKTFDTPCLRGSMVNIRNETSDCEPCTKIVTRSKANRNSASDDNVNTQRHVATRLQVCARGDETTVVQGMRKYRRKKRRVSPTVAQHLWPWRRIVKEKKGRRDKIGRSAWLQDRVDRTDITRHYTILFCSRYRRSTTRSL